jgi:hypothetical protein
MPFHLFEMLTKRLIDIDEPFLFTPAEQTKKTQPDQRAAF